MQAGCRAWILLCVSTLATACADDLATGGESSNEATGDGDPGDGDPGDGDGDPGDGDPEVCAGPDDELLFTHEPWNFGMIDEWDAQLDWSCTVDQVDTSAGLYLLLDCPEAMQPIELDIRSSPAFVAPLVGGETLRLRFVSQGPFWFSEYLRLDVEGHGHLLTMIIGDSLAPPQTHPFELPMDIEPVYEVCPWVEGFCGQLERLRLSFDVGGKAYEVLDGSYARVGPAPETEVWVVEARRLHEVNCTDTPDEWFRVMIVSAG